MYHYSTLFLLASGFVFSTAKCPANSFCFSPSRVNITVTCNKNDGFMSLKWKTEEKRSAVKIYNGVNLLEFVCGFPIGSSNIDVKTYKLETLKSENLTSCEIDFYPGDVLLMSESSSLKWSNEKSEFFNFHEICNPKIEGLSKEFKRLLVKLHAILMILGWLFFVPTGFLFARYGRQVFKNHTIYGMFVWFQIHRASTFIGVCCIVTSILCILISTNWTWKGTGSEAWYWTQWHTDFGTISTILAFSQPLNSLLRCPPSNSQRSIFNWAHRIVGLLSYTFAVAAIYVAAANYRKTWSEPTMEIVLTSVPTILCIATGFVVLYLESEQRNGYREVEMIEKSEKNSKKPERLQLIQISWMFAVVGICFGVAISLSLLIANGFKND
ncbi:ascorbate ferrireductase (transmembrane) [Caenorhabditis elegans]|uniref:ascorbate ferrireductase (transmembrane) n=1 Tax=Caenorhabditis elegans TaxID=6239 RepID=A9Z1K9_CAEEL|nr:Cytochrome b561 domain-containing protein [Caenorhabditis elegans]CCD70555.1 Cytochrome b561 domain-containing protein [Caenorhabditis elegans]|eukprot:NP_001122624.1 Uncharacterized protein CELE_M03A1.8 [Caenorhabditis elegans]